MFYLDPSLVLRRPGGQTPASGRWRERSPARPVHRQTVRGVRGSGGSRGPRTLHIHLQKLLCVRHNKYQGTSAAYPLGPPRALWTAAARVPCRPPPVVQTRSGHLCARPHLPRRHPACCHTRYKWTHLTYILLRLASGIRLVHSSNKFILSAADTGDLSILRPGDTWLSHNIAATRKVLGTLLGQDPAARGRAPGQERGCAAGGAGVSFAGRGQTGSEGQGSVLRRPLGLPAHSDSRFYFPYFSKRSRYCDKCQNNQESSRNGLVG